METPAVEDSSVLEIRIGRTGLRAEDAEKSPSMSGCCCILPLLEDGIYPSVSVKWGFRFLPSDPFFQSPPRQSTHRAFAGFLTALVSREIYSRTCAYFPLYSFVAFCLFLRAQIVFYSLIFFSMCMGVMPARVCVLHTFSTCVGPEGESYPLGQELQTVMHCCLGAVNWTPWVL